MTGERREESVSVSLKELMKLEDERIDRERKLREAHAAAMQRARDDEAKQKQDAEARLVREREAAEAAERAQRAEENARKEAVARAAMEEARLSVEARARAEEADRERRHELELARLKRETATSSGLGPVIGAGVFGIAVAAVAGVIVHFAVLAPKAQASVTKVEERAASAEKRANDVALEAEHERARANKAEADSRAMQQTIDDLKSAATTKGPAGARGTVGASGRGPSTGASAPPPRIPVSEPCASGDDHDPLCGRILRK